MEHRSHGVTTVRSAEPSPNAAKIVPELMGGWPLIGHLLDFLKNPVSMLARGWREQGELFSFRLGPREFVLFTGPEAHDCYFRAPDDQLNAKAVYQFTVPIFGRGVAYDASPSSWTNNLGFCFRRSAKPR